MGQIENSLQKEKKMFVLGLGGLPYSLICRLTEEGVMPALDSLLKRGQLKQIKSVIPTTTSTAWASFLTGRDASAHNIFGFIDREAAPFKLYIPNADKMRGSTLWDELLKRKRRIISINVPLTYPPRQLDGIQIAGYLATDLERAVYPESFYQDLQQRGYLIDVNPWLARHSKVEFLDRLNEALNNRFETIFEMLSSEDWDYFQAHIMETARLHSVFWGDDLDLDSPYRQSFYQFYSRLDQYLNELLNRLDDQTELLLLSDHGFRELKQEVELNHLLEEEGYLSYSTDEPDSVKDMTAESKAYCLPPGRIFINRKGREQRGTVDAAEYFKLRDQIREKLLNLKDETSGEPMIAKVYYREELYYGPYLEQAADLIAVPTAGYDLKARVRPGKLLHNSFNQGMPAYQDAFIYLRGSTDENVLSSVESIQDVKDLILDLL